jgi:hypothetical protein
MSNIYHQSAIFAISCDLIRDKIQLYASPQLVAELQIDLCVTVLVNERVRSLDNEFTRWVLMADDHVRDLDGPDIVPFSDHLVNTLTTEELNDSFKILTHCKCCRRHQDLTGVNRTNYGFKHHLCKCPCRHYSRRIWRTIAATEGIANAPQPSPIDKDECKRLKDIYIG